MIPALFKPNLAATLTKPELIKFPVWASPKIDGIRCAVFGGVAYSRSLKPIPNRFVQAFVAKFADYLERMDGELVVGSATDRNCMQNTTSGVMRKDGEPDFTFLVFDEVPLTSVSDTGFTDRSQSVYDRLLAGIALGPDFYNRVRTIAQFSVTSTGDLDKLEATFLQDGYEGLMIRQDHSKYKYGRSTEREGGLVKVKRFKDAEAEVIGFVEEMRNDNEAKRDALGNTERSTAKDGLVGKGTLGALVVRKLRKVDGPIGDGTYAREGEPFNIGTGFSAAARANIWRNRDEYLGALVKFKYFDHGIKEAPRHPVFISFRHEDDTSK